MSSRLSSESRIYADKARDLNRQVSHFTASRDNDFGNVGFFMHLGADAN